MLSPSYTHLLLLCQWLAEQATINQPEEKDNDLTLLTSGNGRLVGDPETSPAPYSLGPVKGAAGELLPGFQQNALLFYKTFLRLTACIYSFLTQNLFFS
jgi:hypothetical protein